MEVDIKAKTAPTATSGPEIIKQYLPDAFVSILTCESNMRQFDFNGQPLMSPTHDVGIAQINKVHWKEAKALGLDIFNSATDNLKMAQIIYKSEGLEAWTCSKLTKTIAV